MLRGIAPLCLFAVGVSPLGAQTNAAFASWPPGWVDAYHRFENYNSAREKYFPAPNLEITPNGQIFNTIPGTETRLGLDFYKNGRLFLGLGTAGDGQLFDQGRAHAFQPGTYVAAAKPLYPLWWFETYRKEAGSRDASRDSGQLRVRNLPPPEPPDDYWPNERMLKFLDFHIFRRKQRDDILEKNACVTPDIVLRLTNAGVIERDKLDPALEKVLRWRIYHNGRLLEKGPVGGVTRFDVAHGPGNYQAFVGVEGPAGFMPVSNMLEFPLFPEKDGTLAVFPSVTNSEGFPDFLYGMLTPEQLANLLAARHGGEQIKSPYNKRSISLSGSYDDPEKQELFSLWQTWSYPLYRETENLKSVLGRPSAKSMPTPTKESP